MAAFHCYDTTFEGLQSVPKLSQYAAADGYPLWCSEMAPDLLAYAHWLQQQTLAQYKSSVQDVIDASPDVRMISDYVWPALGGY